MKYTYSDEEDGGSDALSTRRSNRHSGISTPAEPNAPTFTASGRQVKSRHGGAYGESILVGQVDAPRRTSLVGMDGVEDDDKRTMSRGRPRRAAQQTESKPKARSLKHIQGYNALDSMDDESDATSSWGEWDGGDDDEDEDLEMSGDDEGKATDEGEEPQQSLVVSLRYLKNHSNPPPDETQQEVQLAQKSPIPLVMSSILERPKPSSTVGPTTNVIEGKTGVLSHDGFTQVSHAVPSMASVNEVGQKASSNTANGLLKEHPPVSRITSHDTSQPQFGTEDNIVR